MEQQDEALHKAVFDSIDDLDPEHHLPRSEKNKIAYDTVLEQKITDGEWVFQKIQESKKEFKRRRNVALFRGYEPFTCLNKRVYRKLIATFGEEVIFLMRDNLSDPEDIYPKWGYRFAYAVKEIGLDDCRNNCDNIYEFVTQHPKWEETREISATKFQEWINEDQ